MQCNRVKGARELCEQPNATSVCVPLAWPPRASGHSNLAIWNCVTALRGQHGKGNTRQNGSSASIIPSTRVLLADVVRSMPSRVKPNGLLQGHPEDNASAVRIMLPATISMINVPHPNLRRQRDRSDRSVCVGSGGLIFNSPRHLMQRLRRLLRMRRSLAPGCALTTWVQHQCA